MSDRDEIILPLQFHLLVLSAQQKALEDIFADVVEPSKGSAPLSPSNLQLRLAQYRQEHLEMMLQAMSAVDPQRAAQLTALCHELPPTNQIN